jgi:diguanylate cyclase (GGDEF)-like protein
MQAQEKFSILLVDDDPTVIHILSHMLSDFAPLRFAPSGKVALKLAHQSVPDLVLLDVEMPEISGFEVCKSFKSDPLLAEVPIIFVTSHESQQLEAIGIQLGAADFIRKPPNKPLVLARVRAYQRLKMLSDTLHGAATLDFVTGALTRRELERMLTQEWLRAERSGAPLTLLLAAVAYPAGDDPGEAARDIALHRIADALRQSAARPSDLLGRYSAAEFALLLPETDVQGASIVAQRAIDAVGALQTVLIVGGSCRASARGNSGEVVGAVPDELIRAAVQGLHLARAADDRRARFVDIASLR